MKILSIDDSRTVRLVVIKAFQPYDCAVLEACNGEEGLELARRERPDLILLDLNMPVMDGIDALEELRADPGLKTTPVIMLTSESDQESISSVMKLGVSDYILKPFAESLLIERVARLFPLEKRKPAAVAVV